MKFRYKILLGIAVLAIASVILLPRVFTKLNNSPEMDFYKNHPDSTYNVFSACKLHPFDVDDCYAAYSAAVYLANSADCSSAGKETKRRFKRLVENSKEDYISEEIADDCSGKQKASFIEKLML